MISCRTCPDSFTLGKWLRAAKRNSSRHFDLARLKTCAQIPEDFVYALNRLSRISVSALGSAVRVREYSLHAGSRVCSLGSVAWRVVFFALVAVIPMLVAGQEKPPTFGSSREVYDLRGLLHVLAVASDGAVWHFGEPGSNQHWLVEPLGGRAIPTSEPAVSLTSGGLLQAWIVSPEQVILTNVQMSDGKWTGWTKVPSPPAIDIAAVTQPDKRTAIVIRGIDNAVQVGWQNEIGKAPQQWMRLDAKATGRPVVFLRPPSALEIVFAGGDGSLVDAIQDQGSNGFKMRSVPAPKAQGDISAVPLLDGTFLAAQSQDGKLLSFRVTDRGWSELRVLPTVPGQPGRAKFRTPDGRSVIAIVPSEQNTFWISMSSESGEWAQWTDTKSPTNGDAAPLISFSDRVFMTSSSQLAILAATSLRRGFFLTIEKIEPSSVFEGDQVTITYTLLNHSSEVGNGKIQARWDRMGLKPTGPALPALQPGESFRGYFTMEPNQSADPGTHSVYVSYDNGVRGPTLPGTGITLISDQTQFADDRNTVQVTGFSDKFEHDDPAVAEGPFACLANVTADQRHTCGVGLRDATGLAVCSGGNTAETCPQDCPQAPPLVRSYNYQTLCRKATLGPYPESIAEVLKDVISARDAGQRIRVVGHQHSSNPQLCTEGSVISTEFLQGAAPALTASEMLRVPRDAPDFCKKYACSTSLVNPSPDPSQLDRPPVVEMFEGMQTVRVGPGMRLFDLENFLDRQGLSLGFAVPGFRDPTVGGAIATGTHGSSPIHPAVLSTRVRWLLMVMPDGTLREFSEQTTQPDYLWKAVRASLGYLGVVVQLRLAVEPSFNLRVTVKWMGAHNLLDPGAPYSLLSGCDWGELIWFPHEGRDDGPVAVICGTKTNAPAQSQGRYWPAENRVLFPAFSNETTKSDAFIDLMQRDACNRGNPSCGMEYTRHEVLRYWIPPFSLSDCPSGVRKVAKDSPPEILDGWGMAGYVLNNAFGGIVDATTSDCGVDLIGKWHLMMSSDLPPLRNRPFQRDWEIYIPGQNAQAALRMAKTYFRTHRPDGVHGICLPLIGVFIRFAPPEDGTLIAHKVNEGLFGAGSTGSAPAGMFFEMPVFLPKGIKCADLARYEKVYSDLAETLVEDFGGRGHWGKNRRSLFQKQRRLGTYGENMTLFRSVVKEIDPKGMFANQFGVDIGLRWPQAPSVPSDTESPSCVP